MQNGKKDLTLALTCTMQTSGTGRKVHHSHALLFCIPWLLWLCPLILDLSVLNAAQMPLLWRLSPGHLPAPHPTTTCFRLPLLPPSAGPVETLQLILVKRR